MSTLKVNTIQDASGKPQYLAKAWVNFNGTGTVAINASGNVSSITDNGVGDYTVNFTSALADANYGLAVCGYQNTTGSNFTGSAHGGTYTSSAVRVIVLNSAFVLTDMQSVSATVFH